MKRGQSSNLFILICFVQGEEVAFGDYRLGFSLSVCTGGLGQAAEHMRLLLHLRVIAGVEAETGHQVLLL